MDTTKKVFTLVSGGFFAYCIVMLGIDFGTVIR